MPPLSQCLVLPSTTPNRPTSLRRSARPLATSGGTFLETTPRIPKTRLITRPSCLRRRLRGGGVRAKEREAGARPSSEAQARCIRALVGVVCQKDGVCQEDFARDEGSRGKCITIFGFGQGRNKTCFLLLDAHGMRSVDISQREHEDWVTVGKAGQVVAILYTWEFGRTTSQPFMMSFLRKHVDPVLSLSFDRRLPAAFPAIG